MFWVEVAERRGPRLGVIRDGLSWSSSLQLSRAGDFNLRLPATGSGRPLVTYGREVHCYTLIGGQATLIFSGIVASVAVDVNTRPWEVVVSGPDLTAELGTRSVHGLKTWSDPRGYNILALMRPLFPPGWSLDTTNGYASMLTQKTNLKFNNESILAALVSLAERFDEKWIVAPGTRQVRWMRRDAPTAAFAATQWHGEASNPYACLITAVAREDQVHEQRTRVYAEGGAQGSWGNVSLRAWVDNAAPPDRPPLPADLYVGQTFVPGRTREQVFIEHRAQRTALGLLEGYKMWSDIAASDPESENERRLAEIDLFNAAVPYIRAVAYPQMTAKLTVTRLPAPILPGEQLRVVFRLVEDGIEVVAVDELMQVVGVQHLIGDGMHTTELDVKRTAEYRYSDSEMLARLFGQGDDASTGTTAGTIGTETQVETIQVISQNGVPSLRWSREDDAGDIGYTTEPHIQWDPVHGLQLAGSSLQLGGAAVKTFTMGHATLDSGQVTVLNDLIADDSMILVTPMGSGSGVLGIEEQIAGSFTIQSSDSSDGRTFAWLVLNEVD